MTINMQRWATDGCSMMQLRRMQHPIQPVWSFECHYCAYDPEPGEGPPARCPKCGGSAWELTPVPGSLLTSAERLETGWSSNRSNGDENDADGDSVLAIVLFRLRCTAAQVYLLLRGHFGAAKMIPLNQAEREEWETRLHLPPGAYRYRFYVDDGTRLTYFDISDVTGRHTSSLDGRLLVPSPDDTAADDQDE